MKRILNLSLGIIILGSLFSCKVTSTQKTEKNPSEVYSDYEAYKTTNMLLDAGRAKISGNFAEAMDLYKKVIGKNPKSSVAYYELANLYMSQKNYTEAVNYAKKAVNLNPTEDWYVYLLAMAYNKNGNYPESTALYQKLSEKNPYETQYYYEWAYALLYELKYMDAIKVYDKIEKLSGIDEQLIEQKEKLYLKLNKVDKAAEELNKLVAHDPREVKYLLMIADMYTVNEVPDKAFTYYQKALEISPGNPFVHLSLSEYYKKKGETQKFFQELRWSFSSPQIDIDTKVRIMLSYYTLTETQTQLKPEAYELLDTLIKTHPNDPKAYSMMGDFLLRDKKDAQARDVFAKVITLDSSKYIVWEQLLYLDASVADDSALLVHSKKALDLFPEQAMPYLFYGSSVFRLSKYEEAVEVLKKGTYYVADNKELNVQFYTYLGDAYNKLKRNPESDEAFDKALYYDANNAYVLNNYSYYLSIRGEKLDKAEEMAKKVNDLAKNNPSYLDTYAWVLYKSKKTPEAKLIIEQAMTFGGNINDVIVEHYGDILWASGEKEKAIQQWEKARTLGKGSEFLDKKISEKKLFE